MMKMCLPKPHPAPKNIGADKNAYPVARRHIVKAPRSHHAGVQHAEITPPRMLAHVKINSSSHPSTGAHKNVKVLPSQSVVAPTKIIAHASSNQRSTQRGIAAAA